MAKRPAPGNARAGGHRPASSFSKFRFTIGVVARVLVVEMPPLRFVDAKLLLLHDLAQQIAAAPLLGRTAPVIRVRPLRHFVVQTGHLHGLSGIDVVKRQVHGTAAIVA